MLTQNCLIKIYSKEEPGKGFLPLVESVVVQKKGTELLINLPFLLPLSLSALTQTGRLDTTRKACSVPHRSWFRMQSWVGLWLSQLRLFWINCLFLVADASFQDFVNSPCMSEIKDRSCFIHVDVPGHADNASPLPEKWVYANVVFPDVLSVDSVSSSNDFESS